MQYPYFLIGIICDFACLFSLTDWQTAWLASSLTDWLTNTKEQYSWEASSFSDA